MQVDDTYNEAIFSDSHNIYRCIRYPYQSVLVQIIFMAGELFYIAFRTNVFKLCN